MVMTAEGPSADQSHHGKGSMLSTFLKTHAVRFLWTIVFVFPGLYYLAETLPANNDIETWLPDNSDVRVTYNQFKETFGAEEVVLIGMQGDAVDDRLIEPLCQRLEQLDGVHSCYSPTRMAKEAEPLGLDEQTARDRLRGLLVSKTGNYFGVVLQLSESGLGDRAGTVAEVRQVLSYSQLTDHTNIAGAPVVIAELDRLGNRKANKRFFIITLGICLMLLLQAVRDFRLSLGLLLLTILSINATLATIHLAGGEMNFILDALPVMCMVFTLAIAVHLVHYRLSTSNSEDPLRDALRLAWKPSLFATLTTTIGLISLTISDIGPVTQFGWAAALGCVIALAVGFGVTPAILALRIPQKLQKAHSDNRFARFSNWVLARRKTVVYTCGGLVLLMGLGLFKLESKIEPLDFLPEESRVLTDVLKIQSDLTNRESIEAIYDFGEDSEAKFGERLRRVRSVHEALECNDNVRHVMSAATMFPNPLPSKGLASILRNAKNRNSTDYVTADRRYWRLSVRLEDDIAVSQQEVLAQFTTATQGEPIAFTGIAPLLEKAQFDIFNGFWHSFLMAFVIISTVMIVAIGVRHWRVGMVAMVPNLTPILIVYGGMGWLGITVDIGMMMAASIALGIAVDGTFHYLVRYMSFRNEDGLSHAESARQALLQTGPPIFQATFIAAIGMLALTLSNFGPTSRFGLLMATMLAAALIGDLILLPCLLAMGKSHVRQTEPTERPVERKPPPAPKFLKERGRRVDDWFDEDDDFQYA